MSDRVSHYGDWGLYTQRVDELADKFFAGIIRPEGYSHYRHVVVQENTRYAIVGCSCHRCEENRGYGPEERIARTKEWKTAIDPLYEEYQHGVQVPTTDDLWAEWPEEET